MVSVMEDYFLMVLWVTIEDALVAGMLTVSRSVFVLPKFPAWLLIDLRLLYINGSLNLYIFLQFLS